jgi:integrase
LSESPYRSVPLAPACVAEVRAYLEFAGITSGRLFVGRGGAERPSQSNWGRSLKRACAKAGVEYRKPYAFRHAFASNAAASGVGVAELAVLMGSSIETLSRYYIHVVSGGNSRTMAALERAFGE